MNPLLLTDGYKTGHHQQYPEGTTLVYSNFTPRSNKYAPKGCSEVVVFGTQMVMQQLHEAFQNDFFSRPKDEVCGEMKRELSMYLGTDYDVSHLAAEIASRQSITDANKTFDITNQTYLQNILLNHIINLYSVHFQLNHLYIIVVV